MSYQVVSNVAALTVYNSLGVHQAKASSALARISSGLRAAGNGDIASQGTATTIGANMRATQSSISQVQYAINVLQVTDTAYGELISLAQKGIDVASQGSDAAADTSALWSQLTAIRAGIASLTSTILFNGAGLIVGGTPDVGNGIFNVTPLSLTPPVVAGASAAGASTANIATTLTNFKTFVASTVDARARNAGMIASLQNTLQVLNSVATNELASLGQVQDADIAKEMMSLTSANILAEASTAMLAQAMRLGNTVLKLLQ